MLERELAADPTFRTAHWLRDAPAVIGPPDADEVIVVVGLVVVVVVGLVVVVGVVVVALPPPPPFPLTGAETVGVIDVALLLPPRTPVAFVVLVVGAVDSVIGKSDGTDDQYFVRPAKRLLPNQ